LYFVYIDPERQIDSEGSWLCLNVAHPAEDQTLEEQRIATVRPVAEGEASGRVAEIFADIRQTKGIDFVPNLWRVLATNPTQLELVWGTLKTLMHPEATGQKGNLDPAMREIIALVVSATNGCAYCVNSHTAALRKMGLSTAALGEALAIASLFNMTNALAEGYQVEPDILPKIE
jgi:AhpD family alkylhydroperoxidase